MSGGGSFSFSDLFSLQGPLSAIGLTGLGPIFGWIALAMTLLSLFGVDIGGGGGGSTVPSGTGGAGGNQAAIATCQSAITNADGELSLLGVPCSLSNSNLTGAHASCTQCVNSSSVAEEDGKIWNEAMQQCNKLQNVCSAATLGSGGSNAPPDVGADSPFAGTGQYYYSGGYYGSLVELNSYRKAQGDEPLSEQEAAKYLKSSPGKVDQAPVISCGCIDSRTVFLAAPNPCQIISKPDVDGDGKGDDCPGVDNSAESASKLKALCPNRDNIPMCKVSAGQ